jgi:DNA-binding NarL/FixJ family response regulator
MIALPGILAEVAEVAGDEAALALARAAGGRSVYVPRPDNVPDGHWLVLALGREAAMMVADLVGGGDVAIPLGPTGRQHATRAEVDTLIGQGLSASRIAQRCGVTERTVERRRAALRAKANSSQLRLF